MEPEQEPDHLLPCPTRRRLRLLGVLAVAGLDLAAACPQPTARQQPTAYDLVIRGGTVIDGSRDGPARRADVAVAGGRVVRLGRLPAAVAAARTVDARGLVVAPGFIDVHAHADREALEQGDAADFTAMGVTTLITGNCGGSVAVVGAHLQRIAAAGIAVNYGTLIGHGTVRAQVMRTANRAPSAAELARMGKLVDAAMADGAFGMSTGLIYVPGTYAATEELIALSRVVARYHGLYVSHMRDEGAGVLDSIAEAVRIGREAGVAVHLSHLKASGKPAWGRGSAIVAALAAARAEGLAVTGDQYAYTASSTSLDVLFPSDALAVGRGAFADRLATDAEFRAEMAASLERGMAANGFGDLAYCRIANAPGNPDWNGLDLRQLAERLVGGSTPAQQAEAAIRLMVAAGGRRVGMVYHKMCESDVAAIMAAPFVAVAADAGIRAAVGSDRPHPRGAGNNPRVLGHYARDARVLPLGLAVHKMTALPAAVFGLEDRGTVREGAAADLTVFDPRTVADRATYDDPRLAPAGIPFVLVNGVLVVDGGEPTGARPGQVLRHRPVARRR